MHASKCSASEIILVSAEPQSAPTGATKPENQEGADRPLGDAACSPNVHSEMKTSIPQHPASSAEPETPEPFSLGFVAMADELLRDKWALAILTGKNSQQDRRQLLVELILWQELGRPDLEELRARFSDDETQERVRELQASPWSEILSLVGLTLCEDGSVIVSGERQSAYTATSGSQLRNGGEAMRPRRDSADKPAGSGCMARLVRCSSFFSRMLSAPLRFLLWLVSLQSDEARKLDIFGSYIHPRTWKGPLE
jgi:hypothetical protein